MRKGQYTLADKDNSAKGAVLLPLTDFATSCSAENENDEQLVGRSTFKETTAESGGRIVWRIANGLMTIFFVMAVGVQFNDPDPYLWVPLYGTAALLTVCITIQPNFTGRKFWRLIYWIHTAFCIGMFCYVFVELIIVAVNPKSDGSLNPLMYEEGRELAGIMITVIWLFTCKQSPRIKSKNKSKRDIGIGVVVVILSLLPLFLWALCYSDVMSSSYFSFCGDYFVDEFSF